MLCDLGWPVCLALFCLDSPLLCLSAGPTMPQWNIKGNWQFVHIFDQFALKHTHTHAQTHTHTHTQNHHTHHTHTQHLLEVSRSKVSNSNSLKCMGKRKQEYDILTCNSATANVWLLLGYNLQVAWLQSVNAEGEKDRGRRRQVFNKWHFSDRKIGR